MTKTIIFAWTTNVNNMRESNINNFWGFGDILRGMLTCYSICKKHKYNYIIDIQKHPISKYLKSYSHRFSNFIKTYNNIPFIIGNDLNSYILNNKGNLIVLMTNGFYPLDINIVDENIKDILRNIFTRNNSFNEYYLAKKTSLNLNNEYSISHFRLGDNSLVRNNFNLNHIKSIYDKYIKDKEKILLLSDNNELKKYTKHQIINNKKNIIINDIKISHIGYSKHTDELLDTLVEFFLVTESKYIETYSVYSWTSGFVLYPSIIFNIPLKKLN